MRYYRYLYKSDSIKNLDKIKNNLNKRIGLLDYFLILWGRGDNQLEIMDAKFLKQSFYKKEAPVVIGLAKTYEEALSLVLDITNESISKTGLPDVKPYLIKRAKTKDFTL